MLLPAFQWGYCSKIPLNTKCGSWLRLAPCLTSSSDKSPSLETCQGKDAKHEATVGSLCSQKQKIRRKKIKKSVGSLFHPTNFYFFFLATTVQVFQRNTEKFLNQYFSCLLPSPSRPGGILAFLDEEQWLSSHLSPDRLHKKLISAACILHLLNFFWHQGRNIDLPLNGQHHIHPQLPLSFTSTLQHACGCTVLLSGCPE